MKCHAGLHALSLAMIFGAAGVWYVTGCEGYTRWPNERLERADAPPPTGQDALLEEAGLHVKNANATPTIESRFALGLLPGGIDAKHIPSVAAASGVSVVLSLVTVIRERRHRARENRVGLHTGGMS